MTGKVKRLILVNSRGSRSEFKRWDYWSRLSVRFGFLLGCGRGIDIAFRLLRYSHRGLVVGLDQLGVILFGLTKS